MNYLGIDFSKNSPGVTLIKEDKTIFFSFVRDYKTDAYTKKGVIRKAYEHHVNIDSLDDCFVISYELLTTNDKKVDYSENEWNKMINACSLASTIVNELHKHITRKEWLDTIIAFEGYSYGSKGNVLIDLVTMTTILKDRLSDLSGDKIYVFSPTQVKSLATGNGRSGKDEMFEYFLKEEILRSSQLRKYCSEVEVISNKIPKPLDDIIDSYFVAKSLNIYIDNS